MYVNGDAEQIAVASSFIEGVGFTVTVTVNEFPVQVKLDGVILSKRTALTYPPVHPFPL